MYEHVCIDSGCFDHWQWCILTLNYLRNTFGWLAWIESGWKLKFEFWQFEKKFDKIRVVYGARVSCPLMCSLLGIYRVNWEGKESEKRLDIECTNFLFQNQIKFLENLIFLPCERLARIWYVSWAILDLKLDKNPLLL